MLIEVLCGKIHRASVTDANLNYVGSITIDGILMEKAGMVEYQKVLVANVNTGSRIETYAMVGERGSGVVCMNGAAARCAQPGDLVIIMAFGLMEPEEARGFKPQIALVDGNNRLTEGVYL